MKYLPFFLFVSLTFSQSSRIELKSLHSAILGSTRQYNILLPDGYDNETDRYPVVYLFRGAVDEWADPTEDASRRGNIKTVYDSLFARNKIGKMILVMPGLSAPATQSEYSYLIAELIPHIDSTYRTLPSRWKRAMDGFSLGGLIVTNLVANTPSLFCSAGSYDGTLSLFNNTLFSAASSALIDTIRQIQLLYHTASNGGNNNANNMATFAVLNSRGVYNALPSFVLHSGSEHNWYNADWHMGVTLPLHWQKMRMSENQLQTAFTMQWGNQKQSGVITPAWSFHSPARTVTTNLSYSADNGTSWNMLLSTTDSVLQYSWNTATVSDGTLYRLKVTTSTDLLFGFAETELFTIDNPGNGAPDVELRSISEGAVIRDSLKFLIYAGDADGDSLLVGGDVSTDDGKHWQIVALSKRTQGEYLTVITDFPNSTRTKVRAWAYDKEDTTYTHSVNVVLAAPRRTLPPSSLRHLSGQSTAAISVNVTDVTALTGDTYRIIFREDSSQIVYDVLNTTTGLHPITGASRMDGTGEGPLFDGIRLLVDDDEVTEFLPDSSGWNDPTVTLQPLVTLINLNINNETINAAALPFDYEITVHSSIADTSMPLYDAPAVPVSFTIRNTTLKRDAPFVFLDFDGDHTLSVFDEIYLFHDINSDSMQLGWHIFFTGGTAVKYPAEGNRLRIATTKPLSANDVYEFTAAVTNVPRSVQRPDAFELFQNYPNPFNPVTVIRYSLPSAQKVQLKVYDLLGREIATLVNKTLGAGVYTSVWDGSRFSSGVYFYRLTTEEGTHLRKMVLVQ